MQFRGSIRLTQVGLNGQGRPVERVEAVAPAEVALSPEQASTPPQEALRPAQFVWSVASPDLGRHRVGDQLATTLSATFNGEKVTSYSLLTGSFPPSIVLAETSGILSGTLTSPGYFVFTLRARVQNSVSDASYRMTVE